MNQTPDIEDFTLLVKQPWKSMKTRWTIHTMIRVSEPIPVNICKTMCLSSRIPSLRKMNCRWKKKHYSCKVGRDPINTLNITVYTVCKYSAATLCSVKLWGECCSIHLASSKHVKVRLYQKQMHLSTAVWSKPLSLLKMITEHSCLLSWVDKQNNRPRGWEKFLHFNNHKWLTYS